MRVRYNITVNGRVQGVGFRYFVLNNARQLGLLGFVNNQIDGSVFIDVQGEREVVQYFIELIKTGPSFAKVDEINTTLINQLNEYNKFSIK